MTDPCRLWVGVMLLITASLASAEGVLPPFDFHEPQTANPQAYAAVTLTRVQFSGNTLFSDAELMRAITGYLNRPLLPVDLIALRDAVTRHYVDAGYLSSGATLAGVTNQTLAIRLRENALGAVQVQSDGQFRSRWLERLLSVRTTSAALNIFELEHELQLLAQHPQIDRLDARVQPGSEPGDAVLFVQAHESHPWHASVSVNNHQSTAVGSARLDLLVQRYGQLGVGDDLSLKVSGAEGLIEGGLAWQLPINTRGSSIALSLQGAKTEIVEPPFDELDIESESVAASLSLRQRFWQDLQLQVDGYLTTEVRRSKTFLLGQGFSFVSGPNEGVVELTLLRAGVDVLWRNRRNVFASRIEVIRGIDALGSMSASASGPDPESLSVFAQMQWGRRLDFLDSQVLLRGDLQLADGPLFGVLQQPVGGRRSVRGYRENTLVRDALLGASLEWRVPLWRRPDGQARIELGPFLDWSHSRNIDRDEIGPSELRSVGLGLTWRPTRRWWAELQWGHALDRLNYPGDYSLQNDGVHLSLQWSL